MPVLFLTRVTPDTFLYILYVWLRECHAEKLYTGHYSNFPRELRKNYWDHTLMVWCNTHHYGIKHRTVKLLARKSTMCFQTFFLTNLRSVLQNECGRTEKTQNDLHPVNSAVENHNSEWSTFKRLSPKKSKTWNSSSNLFYILLTKTIILDSRQDGNWKTHTTTFLLGLLYARVLEQLSCHFLSYEWRTYYRITTFGL